jgi:hypothetical protein
MRVVTHCTIWYGGNIENTNGGETDLVASKQEASLDVVTSAAALVPPEPKDVASLTWKSHKVSERNKRLQREVDVRRLKFENHRPNWWRQMQGRGPPEYRRIHMLEVAWIARKSSTDIVK